MKSFNSEHAKAGAPITPGVKIYDWEFKLSNGITCVMGAYEGRVRYWSHALGAPMRPDPTSRLNTFPQLYMAPIGTLEGRDVHWGDTLNFLSPRSGGIKSVKITTAPMMDVINGIFNPTYWSWPAAYPVTQMTVSELADAFNRTPATVGDLSVIANAAIRHGIDNGYLLDAEGGGNYFRQAKERGNYLGQIAHHCGRGSGFAYADVLTIVQQREVAIAKAFYSIGHQDGTRNGKGSPPDSWFADTIAKVQS